MVAWMLFLALSDNHVRGQPDQQVVTFVIRLGEPGQGGHNLSSMFELCVGSTANLGDGSPQDVYMP